MGSSSPEKTASELTAVKKTSEITSDQELAWARRVEVQGLPKALKENTKGNKEFDAVKRH